MGLPLALKRFQVATNARSSAAWSSTMLRMARLLNSVIRSPPWIA
jgi:hypothetical protein